MSKATEAMMAELNKATMPMSIAALVLGIIAVGILGWVLGFWATVGILMLFWANNIQSAANFVKAMTGFIVKLKEARFFDPDAS